MPIKVREHCYSSKNSNKICKPKRSYHQYKAEKTYRVQLLGCHDKEHLLQNINKSLDAMIEHRYMRHFMSADEVRLGNVMYKLKLVVEVDRKVLDAS